MRTSISSSEKSCDVKDVQVIVSHWFMKEISDNHDGTRHATDGSLGMRALLVTAVYEAILTWNPPFGRSQIREEEAKLQASCGSGARLGSMVNRCASVINLVNRNMPKMLEA